MPNTDPTKLIATTNMRIVSMIEFGSKIYLACEHAVFVHDPAKGDFDFKEMEFICLPPKKEPGRNFSENEDL
jgi:hypothetical protein